MPLRPACLEARMAEDKKKHENGTTTNGVVKAERKKPVRIPFDQKTFAQQMTTVVRTFERLKPADQRRMVDTLESIYRGVPSTDRPVSPSPATTVATPPNALA